MKSLFLTLALSAAAVPLPAASDSCRGAMNLLNRLKEEITPALSAPDAANRKTLQEMDRSLKQASDICQSEPEIYYYRALIESKLGIPNDFVKRRAAGFQLSYDPFTPPPSATPPANDSPVVRNKWALVVGINKFKDPGIGTLRYAAKDASDFGDFLEDPKGGRFEHARVHRILNEDATLQGIHEGIGWLRNNVREDDLVVVYFASHGSARTMDPNGMSYILTHDSDVTDPVKLYATSVQMIDLVQQLNRDLRVRRVILFLDTCFSGDAAGARGVIAFAPSAAPSKSAVSSSTVFSKAFDNFATGMGRAVITASRADQLSQESEALHNGVFTSCLLASMRSGGSELPLGKVFEDVRDRVIKTVRNQTPSSQFSGKADSFVLGVAEGQAPAASSGGR